MKMQNEISILVERLRCLLGRYRFTFGTERQLQDQLENIFQADHLEFQREYILTKADRLDFLIDAVAIEVKIGGSINTHLRQLKRYNDHAAIRGGILIGTKPFDMPDSLSDKAVALINLSKHRL
jgi:hypothetical protein